VIQEQRVPRLGSTEPVSVNVRIISASNRNLLEEVAKGNFREDLFHRLAIGVLQVPALRDRKGDSSVLIDHFMNEINREFRQIHAEGWADRKLSANARDVLLRHSWPGNIRELRNTLSRLVLWAPGKSIRRDEVATAIFANPNSDSREIGKYFADLAVDGEAFCLPEALGEMAAEYIEKALKKTAGNKSEAAKLLGFNNYQTLDNWHEKYRKSDDKIREKLRLN